MKEHKCYGRNGVAIYTGDVVAFEHKGVRITIVVEEIKRGCVRGARCDAQGRKYLPEKRWRAKVSQCELAA